MEYLSPDSFDFSAYEWETTCKAKVRQSASYADELAKELHTDHRDTSPSVFSLKMARVFKFRPGEVTAWAGWSGHRKSMLTGQVAVELAKQRVKTLVISLEMSPVRTLARMARQFAGVHSPHDLQRFHDATQALYLFDHQGRISPSQCMSVCQYFAKELGGSQVFVDSFMMVCGSEESMDQQKQMTTDLVRMAQDLGLHIHLIAHCRKPSSGDESKPPGKHDLRGSAAITDQCANVVTIWSNKAKEERLQQYEHDMMARAEPDAAITICKQRNGEYEGRLKLWLDRPSLRFTDDREDSVQPW